ncbi:MAG: hypothetical protein JW900_09190 [Anaerolineae bacterium]|nr:hypothetical protein [Anaerolineae bacterium]
MKKWIVLWTVLLFSLTSALPVWAQAPAQEGTEIEVEGTLEEVDLAAGVIVVDGTRFFLVDSTVCLRGRGWHTPVAAEELVVGQWVEVAGVEQADGTLQARHVRIKDAPGGPDDASGADPHPAAVKLSTYLDVTYEEVIALHVEGVGFGEIARAYRLAAANSEAGVSGADLLQMRLEGVGWGEVCKQIGIHPGNGRPPWAGQGHSGKGDS